MRPLFSTGRERIARRKTTAKTHLINGARLRALDFRGGERAFELGELGDRGRAARAAAHICCDGAAYCTVCKRSRQVARILGDCDGVSPRRVLLLGPHLPFLERRGVT